jgi:hypothetical protein
MQINRMLIKKFNTYDLPFSDRGSKNTKPVLPGIRKKLPLNCDIIYISRSSEEISILQTIFPASFLSANIHLCNDLHTAYEILNQKDLKPELIIVDTNTGDFLSRAFVSMLKMDLSCRYIPTVAIGEGYSEEEVMKNGFDDFCLKPARISELQVLVVQLTRKWLIPLRRYLHTREISLPSLT